MFEKGCTPWNKGIKMWDCKQHPRGMLGKKHTESTKTKIKFS